MHRYDHSVIGTAVALAEGVSGTGDWPTNAPELAAWLRWRVDDGWERTKENFGAKPRYAHTVRELARSALMMFDQHAVRQRELRAERDAPVFPDGSRDIDGEMGR